MKRRIMLGVGCLLGMTAGRSAAPRLRSLLGVPKAAEAAFVPSIGPGGFLSAVALSDRAYGLLGVESDQPSRQFLTGFATGLALTLLAGPIQRALGTASTSATDQASRAEE